MGIHQNSPKLNALMESDLPDDAIYYPEYDKAIIGSTSKGQVVYDIELCIQALINDQDMDYETATEHFWFNTEGSYVGEMTPIFLHALQL
jgi:hypothetical protein